MSLTIAVNFTEEEHRAPILCSDKRETSKNQALYTTMNFSISRYPKTRRKNTTMNFSICCLHSATGSINRVGD